MSAQTLPFSHDGISGNLLENGALAVNFGGASFQAEAASKLSGLRQAILETITRHYTAFASFADLLDAAGNYRPTLRVTAANRFEAMCMVWLADAYDAAQAERNDSRRAYRD